MENKMEKREKHMINTSAKNEHQLLILSTKEEGKKKKTQQRKAKTVDGKS